MGQTRINSEFAWLGAITRLKSRPALGCLQAAPSSALGFFSRSRFTTNGHGKIQEARRRGGDTGGRGTITRGGIVLMYTMTDNGASLML